MLPQKDYRVQYGGRFPEDHHELSAAIGSGLLLIVSFSSQLLVNFFLKILKKRGKFLVAV